MAKIIFEHTPHSTYAAQGGSPSGQEGYDIWLMDLNETTQSFLGWCREDEFEKWVDFYQQQGDKCYLKELA